MQPIVLINKTDNFKEQSECYIFRNANGRCYWPKKQGQKLGQGGMWNFLWRIGFHPQQNTIDHLPDPQHVGVLFVDSITAINDSLEQKLRRWMNRGGKIVATGELASWKSFLPSGYSWRTSAFKNPYAALAYLVNDEQPQLISPPHWTFIEYEGVPNYDLFTGQIAAVQGERQTPTRAHLLRYAKAPAVIQVGLFYYFNGHPFSALQAWLQGQENLSPWLAWRHRLFWLDEWISYFCNLMLKHNILNKLSRPGIKGLNKTTIILRHDLDYSRDLSFLSEENKCKVDATYALLKDRNTQFWLRQLKPFPNHEIAFHYNTGKRNVNGLITRLLTKKNRFSFLPCGRRVGAAGLLKQLKWAKKNGIGVQSIHRHLCYLIYPEWIDAMDTTFESNLNVMGSSSLFRGQVLRWGIDRVEGNIGFLGEWPDAQFPFWYPFKLVHAGKNGKILNGWEMTALMEIEPELFSQLLNYSVKHISQNIFTLIFHPAHAHQSSFYKEGSYNYFKSILNLIVENKIDVIPMANVFQRANESFLKR